MRGEDEIHPVVCGAERLLRKPAGAIAVDTVRSVASIGQRAQRFEIECLGEVTGICCVTAVGHVYRCDVGRVLLDGDSGDVDSLPTAGCLVDERRRCQERAVCSPQVPDMSPCIGGALVELHSGDESGSGCAELDACFDVVGVIGRRHGGKESLGPDRARQLAGSDVERDRGRIADVAAVIHRPDLHLVGAPCQEGDDIAPR